MKITKEKEAELNVEFGVILSNEVIDRIDWFMIESGKNRSQTLGECIDYYFKIVVQNN